MVPRHLVPRAPLPTPASANPTYQLACKYETCITVLDSKVGQIECRIQRLSVCQTQQLRRAVSHVPFTSQDTDTRQLENSTQPVHARHA